MSTFIHATQALLPTGWANDVRIELAGGEIVDITTSTPALPGDDRHAYVVPGMPNLHSHAFQRAMAGLAEVAGPTADTFWTWRDVMYRVALSLDPEQAEAVATMLYIEMLEAGFTRVGEFHYLHHQPDGSPYADIAEMAVRIASATTTSGIALTLLPVYYAHSDFGGVAPTPGQRRFITNLDTYSRLLDRCIDIARGREQDRLGIAPHSLRAVTPEELRTLVEIYPEGPIHMHAAEQEREVADSLRVLGARPVEWLLETGLIDERWCLIHATHMTESEAAGLADTGAIAGLCPITEANLGDGIFPAPAFMAAAGRYGIGTDSNVQVSVAGELRQLEYAQRLGSRRRNVMASDGAATGRALFDAARLGGNHALNASNAGMTAGSPADLVSLRCPMWENPAGDSVLNGWIFAQGVEVDAVWAAGQQVVRDGRHHQRDAAEPAFRAVIRDVLGTDSPV